MTFCVTRNEHCTTEDVMLANVGRKQVGSVALVVLAFLGLHALPALALVQEEEQDRKGWHVNVDAGAGFAGLKAAELLQVTAYSPLGNGEYARTDSIDLVKNYKYAFKPAISTGIVFRRTVKTNGFGYGLGVHVVFLPIDKGTKPVPGFTLQFGTRKAHVFGGFVLAPADKIRFPNDPRRNHDREGDTFRVPAGNQTDQFILTDHRTAAQFYLGVVIAGTSIIDPKPRKDEESPAKSEEENKDDEEEEDKGDK